MRTAWFHRRNTRPPQLGRRQRIESKRIHRRLRGFSLLELMVVLSLLGLVTLLAFPNLQRLYEGFAKRSEQGRILNQIAGLGREAMLRGRAYGVYETDSDSVSVDAGSVTVDADGKVLGFAPYPLEIPANWELALDRPLLVRANGVCLGANLTLLHQGEPAVRLMLEAPYCRVDNEV